MFFVFWQIRGVPDTADRSALRAMAEAAGVTGISDGSRNATDAGLLDVTVYFVHPDSPQLRRGLILSFQTLLRLRLNSPDLSITERS